MHDVHRLELTVADEAGAIERIVSLCRARRCAIVSLHFEAPNAHRPGRLTIGFRADARRAKLATERLAGLIDVISVAPRRVQAPPR